MINQDNLSRQVVARGQHRSAPTDTHRPSRQTAFGPRVRNTKSGVVPASIKVIPQPQLNQPIVQIVAPQPFALPAHPKPQVSKVLHRNAVKKPVYHPHHQVAVVHNHRQKASLLAKTMRKLKLFSASNPVLDT